MLPGRSAQHLVGPLAVDSWPRLRRALEHPKWIDDPRRATLPQRVANRKGLHDLVAAAKRSPSISSKLQKSCTVSNKRKRIR